MRTLKASRIRFGILTARDRLSPERLTFWQQIFLLNCEILEWVIGDRWTAKAHDREYTKLYAAHFEDKP